jgi:uncharacterized iron-regulated membrane protein
VATLSWVLVVGATGVVNTLAEQVLAVWRADQLAGMTAPWRGQPPVEATGSVEGRGGRGAAGGAGDETVLRGVAANDVHQRASLRGVPARRRAAHTRRLLTPALVHAQSGALVEIRPLPWYVTALLVSQPLHFGDYGGLPLRSCGPC